MPSITVRRLIGKRTSDEKVRKQIDYLVKRALTGPRGRGWELTRSRQDSPIQMGDGWAFTYHLSFSKTAGHKNQEILNKQWHQIKQMLEETGQSVRFQPAWKIVSPNEQVVPTQTTSLPSVKKIRELQQAPAAIIEQPLESLRNISSPSRLVTWDDLHVPLELLGARSDYYIAKHPCFQDLYGLNAQIRIALTGIQSAAETKGKRRGHFVFHGKPACGKTSVLLGTERMFGDGCALRLDATSTTRAGLEKMFFNPESGLRHVPPLVFCEEIEKAKEDWLQIWLGALDERGEVRKVNNRMAMVRLLNILFFCTVNNKKKFDKMMSHESSGDEKGALSSRCVNQLYFPRPSDETIQKILQRDIRLNGGKEEWVKYALKLAKDMKTNDPREIVSFLAGGDRLLSGEYQKDRLAVHEMEKEAG